MPESGTQRDERWWHRFSHAIRTEMQTSPTPTLTSVLTARVAVDAADRLGLHLSPVPVFVGVYTTEAWEMVRTGIPESDWPFSAQAVGIDERARLAGPHGWAGHLVVVADHPDESRLIIDANADRFDRPIRNLLVGGALVVRVAAGADWSPRTPAFGSPTDTGDVVVAYRPVPPGYPGVDGWERAHDWAGAPAAVARISKRVADRLIEAAPFARPVSA